MLTLVKFVSHKKIIDSQTNEQTYNAHTNSHIQTPTPHIIYTIYIQYKEKMQKIKEYLLCTKDLLKILPKIKTYLQYTHKKNYCTNKKYIKTSEYFASEGFE